MVADSITARCGCGAVEATVRDTAGVVRLVCMCRGCQTYARFLGREEDMLDAAGGTDLYMLAPAQVSITAGAEELRCARMTSRGAMRWYAGCCRTPVANSLESSRVAWLSMSHVFMDHPEGLSREEGFAPVRWRIHARYARRAVEGAHRTVPPALALWALGTLGRATLRGQQRPSPFFREDGSPRSAPVVLDAEQRAALGYGDHG